MVEIITSNDFKGEKKSSVKFIKNHPCYFKGTILHCGKGRAGNYVKNGFAEFFETEEKNMKKEMEKARDQIRKSNADLGQKIPGNTPGRKPEELSTPGFIRDPEPSKKVDPKCYRDKDNPRIKQIKKEEQP